MAQSALTVTPPSPTPPTNFQFTGATGPNPPNLTKLAYAGAFANPPTNQPTAAEIDYDTPVALTDPLAFAANKAAFTFAGTGATSGGTEGTYPGTGTGVNGVGAVPASTSVAHEGAGTESVATQTYPATVFVPGGSTYSAGMVGGPLRTFSDLGNFTGTATAAGVINSPNATHASTLSPAVNPALVSISPTTLAAATTGTQVITCTGTGFVPGCRVWHDNVEYPTTFVSATSITALVNKRTSAGVVPVVVKLGGVRMGAAPNFTWT